MSKWRLIPNFPVKECIIKEWVNVILVARTFWWWHWFCNVIDTSTNFSATDLSTPDLSTDACLLNSRYHKAYCRSLCVAKQLVRVLGSFVTYYAQKFLLLLVRILLWRYLLRAGMLEVHSCRIGASAVCNTPRGRQNLSLFHVLDRISRLVAFLFFVSLFMFDLGDFFPWGNLKLWCTRQAPYWSTKWNQTSMKEAELSVNSNGQYADSLSDLVTCIWKTWLFK